MTHSTDEIPSTGQIREEYEEKYDKLRKEKTKIENKLKITPNNQALQKDLASIEKKLNIIATLLRLA